MAEAVAFYVLSAFILGFAVLVITARNTVHSVLFLVLNFLCVAALYVVLAAVFLAVILVLVYAGGIVVLYLFVVMLVNLKRPPETHQDPRRHARLGLILSGIVLFELAAVVGYGIVRGEPSMTAAASSVPAGLEGNTEQLGWLLYTDYLVPFELASMLLLVAMIGAIILAKREL